MDAVEVSFVERSMRALDASSADVVVGAVCEDERPPRGLAGLLDWRLGARLSAECQRGFLTGALGERLLLPVRPRFAFEKALLFGLGPRGAFDDAVFAGLVPRVLDALEGLRPRRVLIELPGRHLGALPLARALELFVPALDGRTGALESLVVVDERDAERGVDLAKLRPARRTLAGRR
jgi:hypothetical protein